MNRLDRLTAILVQLQSKRVIRAQEIADRFDVSLRTIYRDVKSLEEAGIPVIGEVGIGYSLMEGYKLPPVMFSRDEATAFLVAEKMVEKYTDPVNAGHYKTAMYKVKAVLRSAEKDMMEDLEERISVQKKTDGSSPLAITLPALLKSISEKKAVHIHYAVRDENNASGQSERTIEPIGIFYEDGHWSTMAYCHVINDYRHFRTDRILGIALTDAPFHKTHMTLNTYFDQVAEKKNLLKVVINVNLAMTRHLQDQKLNYGFVSEQVSGNTVKWTFLAPCIEAFSRWYITFADQAKIVEPEMVRVFVKDLVNDISKEI